MKKNGIKPVCWKRILAALFAAVLILQTVPSHLAVSASASETKTQTQSQTHATEKEKEEKDSSPAAAAEEKSAADKKNSETDKSSSKTEGSKSDSSKEDEKTDKKKSNSDKTNAKDSENKSADTKDSGDKKTDDKKSDDDKTDDNKSDDKKSDDTKSGDSKTDEKSKESGTENSGSSKTSLNKKDEEQSAEGKSGQSKEKEEQKQESGAGQSGKSSEENKSGAAGTESDSGDASKKDSTGNSGKTGEEAAGDTKDSDSSDDKKEGSENSGNGSASESADKEEGSKEDDGQKSDGKDASESEKTTENGGNAASTNKKAEEENSDGKKDNTEIGNTKAGTGKSGNNQEDSTKKEADSEKKDEGGIEKTPAKEESGQITGGAEEKTETDNASARKEGETQVPEVTISYKGYRTGSSGDYSGSSKQSVLTNAEKLQFKFGFTGPDDTKLQYKLVDSTEDVSEKNWKTVDSGDISGSDGVITVSGGDDGFDAAKKLYVRAYSESAEEGKREAKAKFGDDEKSHLSVDIDRKAPVVSITKPTEDILTKDSAEYELSVTERNAINVYSRTADQGSLSSDPSYPGEEGDWKKNKENVTSDSDKDKCEITFSDEGKKDVWFVVRDAAGNVSEVKKAKAYLIDKTAPVITLTAPDEYSNSLTVVAEFSDKPATGDVFSGCESYSYVLKNGESVSEKGEDVSLSSDKDGKATAQIVFSNTEYNGDYELTVTAKDKAGNTAEPVTKMLHFDNNGPEISLSLVETDEHKDKDGIYHYTTAALKAGSVVFKKSGENGNLKKVVVLLSKEGDESAVLRDTYEESSFSEKEKADKIICRELAQVIGSTTETLGDGKWTISAYAEDTSGNITGNDTTPVVLKTLIIDDTAPALKLADGDPVCEGDDNKFTYDGKIYYKADATVIAQLVKASEEPDNGSLRWSVSVGTPTDLKTEGNETDNAGIGSLLISKAGEASEFPREIIFTALDLAGNTGTVTFTNNKKYYFDRQAPTIEYTANKDFDIVDTENTDTVTYNVTITDGTFSSGIDNSSIKYAVVLPVTGNESPKPVESDWNYPVSNSLSSSNDGKYTFKVEAPKKGVVYVRADDNLKNGPAQIKANTLVIEQGKPVITKLSLTPVLSDDGGELVDGTREEYTESGSSASTAKNYKFEITAKDEPASEFSGLRYVYYQLKEAEAEDCVLDTHAKFNNSVVEEPTKLGDLVKNGDSSVFTLPENLNGKYKLIAWVTDFCGNKSNSIEIELEFDNADPVIDLEMGGGALASEGYTTFYQANNCGLTVTITEANIKKFDIYAGNLTLDEKTVTEDGKWTVTDLEENGIKTGKQIVIEAAAIVGEDGSRVNEDGTVEVTVEVSDKADTVTKSIQSAVNMEKKEENGRIVSASFTLDTTAPVVSSISVYKGQDIVDKDVVYGDTNAAYFNVAVKITFGIDDANYDDKLISGASYSLNGSESGSSLEKDSTEVSATLDSEGLYQNISIKGTDKAGNDLKLKTDYEKKTDCAEASVSDTDGIVLEHSFILDWTAPTAVISYASDATAYLYADSDGVGLPESAAYLNKEITTTITISDKYGDSNSVIDGKDATVKQYNKLASDANYTAIDPGTYWNSQETASSLVATSTINEEGHYYYTLNAVDRAGNTLAPRGTLCSIQEGFEKNTDKKDLNVPSLPKTDGFNDDNDGGFQAGFMLVYDKKAPTIVLEYHSKNTGYVYKDRNGDDNSVASSTDLYVFLKDTKPVQVDATLSEANFDADRMIFTDNDHSTGTEWSKGSVQVTGTGVVLSLQTTDGEGEYRYSVYGTDKAGNNALVTETFTGGTECHPSNIQLPREAARGTAYTPPYTVIVDRTAPVLNMQYTPSTGNVSAYVYEEDINNKDKKTAYISEKTDVSVVLEESYYDLSRLSCQHMKDGTVTNCTWDEKRSSWNPTGTEKTLTLDSAIDDGRYGWSVWGEDRAGNAATVKETFNDSYVKKGLLKPMNGAQATSFYEEVNHSSGYDRHYTIVIDKTAPQVALTYHSQNTAHVYIDKNDDQKAVASPTDFYAYLKDMNPVEVDAALSDTNYDADRMAFTDNNHSAGTTWRTGGAQATGTGAVLSLQTTDGEGEYRYSVYGTDKAGNIALVTESFTGGTECHPSNIQLPPETARGADYKPPYTVIIDWTAPKLIMQYTPLPGNVRAYVYEEDTNNKDKKTAYISGNNGVSVKLVESYYDLSRLSYQYMKDSNVTNYTWDEKRSGWNPAGTEKTLTLDSATDDGRYGWSVWGEDRAGNAATVIEMFNEDYVNNGLLKTWDGQQPTASYKETDHSSGYERHYTIVIDKTAPQVALTYHSQNTAYVYKDRNDDKNAVASPTDFYAYLKDKDPVKVDATLSDTNYDADRMLFTDNERGTAGTKWSVGGAQETETEGKKTGAVLSLQTADKEGEYRYSVYGTDKAGNVALVTESFTGGTTCKPDNYVLPATIAREAAYTPPYTVIVDRTAPVLTMQYTPAPRADRSSVYAFVYNKEGTKREEAYISGDSAVNVKLDEAYYDLSRLKYVQTKDGKNTLQTGKGPEWAKKSGAWDADTKTLTLDTANNDGVYTWIVYGEDRAGNAATVVEKFDEKQVANNLLVPMNGASAYASRTYKNKGEVFDPHYDVVIDKTAPEVSNMITMVGAKTNEDGDYDSEKMPSPKYYKDDKTFYYNTESGVRTAYTVLELNFDEKRMSETWAKEGAESKIPMSWTKETDKEQANQHTYILAFPDDATYENVRMAGTDKAGNHLVLKGGNQKDVRQEDWQASSSYDVSKNNDKPVQQSAALLVMKGETAVSDKVVNDKYGYVDTEVMLARRRILDRISPEAVITHVIPDNTTGYLYPHEEGDKDDNVKNTATMYSKNIVSTAVSVSDQYGNGDSAKAVLLDGDKLEVQRLFREAGGKFVSSNIKTVDWKKHPAKATPFRTNVSTDKEGRYAFTIKGTDRAGNPVHVSEKLKTDKANKAVYDRKKGGYEGEVKNEEATKTGGTYSSFFVLVYDATAPVYRFKINNPENLNETFDNTKGKQIAYYGASIPKIDAKYVVKDSNFDETRIHSAITSLSAKENGKRINNVDGLKPDWVSPANQCSKTSEKDGLVTAAFPLPVAVNAGNEGVYRFEIEGCDKAGNLLVRSNVQEKVDASSALKDLAARTVDKKRGTGRFWSERKVIDVTAPTGIFRVRKDKNGKDNYYQIGFKEGGNTADNYDPFRKETSAYVIVESDDQSPTRVSYDLRSLDKSKDSSYKSKNPLVSEGDHGYGNDNFRDVSVNGEQAFYIEHLVIKDRAGNIRANDKNSQYTLAQSNNVYLDVTPPVVSKINDAESPQVKIVASGSFTRHEADGERYIYKPEGPALDLKVSIEDPGGEERSSGLKEVTLEVTVGSRDLTSKVHDKIIYKYGKTGGKGNGISSNEKLVYTIPDCVLKLPTGNPNNESDTFESNDITIKVTAEDNSGNISVPSKDGGLLKLGIDTTPPKVQLKYDCPVQPENEKFFRADRTVQVIVIDRNVDNSKISIETNTTVPGSFTAPHANKSTDGGENGNQDQWLKTLNYNVDGDYTLKISGADALGNKLDPKDIVVVDNAPAPYDFTIDKTAPKISVILPNTEKNVVNGTKYYDQSITGTIRIEEHNFQEDDKVKVEPKWANRGDDPEVGPLSKTKFGGLGTDVHESTIDYTKDGDYEITAAYTDKAGNIAVVEGGEGKKDDNTAWSGKFVVDLKDPVLEMDGATFRVNPATKKPLEGLVNQIYTEKDFAPLVHVNDTNYDAANSGFEVRTIGSGTNRASYQVKNQQDYKFDIQFDTFKVEKEMDGVYSVTAIATDLAKRTSTLEFKFSVNRFGSTYDYADGPTEDKVNRYYINDTKEPLRILEITPVDLKTHTMELFKDHERRTLKDGEEYTFATAAGRTIDETSVEGHRIYEYTVDPSVFDAEGVYDFIISSKDIAGNENSTSVYRDGTKSGNTIERVKFPIEFQVDKTVPVNRITGVESEKTRFQQDKLEITVFPEDYQTDISDVEVRIYTGNESGTNASEDEAKYQHYRYISEEEDAVKLAGEHVYPIEDAKKGIPVTLDGKNGLRSWQLLEVITTDLAGNKSTDYRVGDESVKLPETRRKFLVSTNPLIQYYYNRPLFFGSFGVAAALILLFLFLKSRKDKKEKGAA